MFICELCGVQVPAGIACRRVVVETRKKTYPARILEETRRGGKRVKVEFPAGHGREIVRELRACPACQKPEDGV